MLEMIKQEFKNIYHNKILLVSTLVICIIPFLYSIFFLKSVWDPYGNTQDLPVAVVNKDDPVVYQGRKMDVGDQTIRNLKTNHALKWEFVSAKKAQEGLKDRKYYTVVTIPKDFSKNATTVLDKHPKTMKLKYETNDSLNMIGEVISQMGMQRLNTKIRASVTNAYASAMFKELHVVGKGMNRAASGAKQLDSGIVTLNNGVNQYVAGVSQVNNGVQELRMGVTPLTAGAAQLASGSQTLANGIQQYTGGVGLLGAGVSQLVANSGALNSGASQLQAGVGQFAGGVNQLNAGLGTLDSNSAALNSGANQLAGGAGRLANGAAQFNSQVSGMLPGVQNQMAQMSGNVEQNAVALRNALAPLANSASSLTQLSSQLGTISSQLGQLQKAAESQSQPATAQTTSTNNAAANINDAKSQLSGIDQSKLSDADKAKLNNAMNALNSADTSSKTTTTTDNRANTQLAQQIGELKAGVDQLQAAVNKSAATSGQNAQQVMTAAAGLENSLNAMKTGSNQALNSISSQLTTATSSLANGANQLQSGAQRAQAGINQYTAGVHTAAAGAGLLAANTGALQSGASQLASGIGQYTNGVGQLGSGIAQLNANSGQLNSGAMQLASALGQLNNQIPTLVAGVNQLAAGTQQLQDNSPALISGIARLNAGAGRLASSLGKGAKAINGIKPTARTAKMFAEPTQLQHKNYSYVPNYGHALAPYVLSVALYVGMLVFNFVYPIRRIAAPGKSATAWWGSKVVIGSTAAIAMAVVEDAIMMACGLTVDHVPSFFLTTICFGLASMAIVMFLSMTFDNPGRFLAMVLLMLQLGGSGGTFPMEVTMKFYNVIHWFLPMTYSIQGLRQSISSGLGQHYAMFCNSVLLGIAVVFFLLLWASMAGIRSHTFNLFPRLDKNQKFLDKMENDGGIQSDEDNK
ncbi:YhgE/Pip family protein [Limosilactobacillus sp.]|uniref:YhgE/Pip family protein n=1 Tax=Limosilactobacillus sp. TaxID=2773925 RepID=UPI00345E56D6